MLEWYRKGVDYSFLMEDAEGLVLAMAHSLGLGKEIGVMGERVDLTPPWPRITVSEAFLLWAGVAPTSLGEDEFRDIMIKKGYQVSPLDDWETCYHYLFVAEVEPKVAEVGTPIFLCEYPARLSVMAKPKEGDNRVCERVELYIGGVEVMNGYSELTDPEEQRRRLEVQRRVRGVDWPIDEDLLEALPLIGSAAGAAMGVDRLLMCLLGKRGIAELIFGV